MKFSYEHIFAKLVFDKRITLMICKKTWNIFFFNFVIHVCMNLEPTSKNFSEGGNKIFWDQIIIQNTVLNGNHN